MKKIKVGVIGGGMISQIAHLPFYLSDSRVEVAALSESRPSLIAHLRNVFDIKEIHVNYHNILDDKEIKTVIIIAPRQANSALIFEALSAGKNVITEKPMAFTKNQAERLVDTARKESVKLNVGFMRRYDANIQFAKKKITELFDNGHFGCLLFARIYDFAKSYACPPPAHKRPEESRTNRFETWAQTPDWLPQSFYTIYDRFINAASHDINLAHYFFGNNLTLRHAELAPSEGLTAFLVYKNTPVLFEWISAETGVWSQGIEFVFERGQVTLELPSPMDTSGITRIMIDDNAQSNTDGYTRTTPAVPMEWCFKSQARAFIDDLTGEGYSLTSGKDCLKDMVLIENIWKKLTSTP
tara:strand:- start:169 stop:1233 length:1065 start_codon:yes stop_codon:yes gene_type:complete